MKKSAIILGIICLSLICSLNVFADDISIYVDNELVQLTDATGANVYPFIQNGTTYVPLRGISETLDCDVVWDEKNNTVLIYKEMQSDNSVFRNNSTDIKLYVDNQLVELKDANGTTVKPFVKKGTTYVPLRGVSQALGCWVRWNGQTKTASVYMNVCPPDGVTLSENKPYKTDSTIELFYESEGKELKIDSKYYTNSIYAGKRWGNENTLFNLESKFKRLTMSVGSTHDFESEKKITFVVDGKIVYTHTVKANSSIENLNIPLNNGMQLKVVVDGNNIGMGNIIFWGE